MNALQSLIAPINVSPLKEQPTENIQMACGIYFRSVLLKEAGTVIPQHEHDHDHATYVASGSARLWVNASWKGDFKSGEAIEIKSGQRHLFMSLEPNTRLTCVHDLHSAALIKEA